MKQYSMKEVEKAMGGILLSGDGNAVVTSVSKDSRKAKRGDLFFPLIGENHDGHIFIPEAMERGCRDFVISSREWEEKLSGTEDVRLIRVPDTSKALGDLARDYLEKMDIKIIGITGSTGKTSTKDLTRQVCSSKYKTGYTKGNLNNHIGLPLTILSFDQDTQVGILEMGMDKPGEIEYLAKIACPDIALITNIGISHIENVGSREGIFRCKMEITDCFEKDNLLIVSEGEDFLRRETIKEVVGDKHRLQVCGKGDDCDFILSQEKSLGEKGISFSLEHQGHSQAFYLPVPGLHNIYNASLGIAAGLALGISMAEAAEALSEAVLTEGRLAVKKAGGVTVIDDTYNASPDSMMAALDLLMTMEGKRKIAVLGDMYELGEETAEHHRKVGRYAFQKGVDQLSAVGILSKNTAEGYGKTGKYFREKNDFLQSALEDIDQGDVILVKGSRGMAMEEIVDGIIARRSK